MNNESRYNYYFPAAAFEHHSLPPYPINPPGNGVLWIFPYFISRICISYFFSRAFSALSSAFSASISETFLCNKVNISLNFSNISDAVVAMIDDDDITIAWRGVAYDIDI